MRLSCTTKRYGQRSHVSAGLIRRSTCSHSPLLSLAHGPAGALRQAADLARDPGGGSNIPPSDFLILLELVDEKSILQHLGASFEDAPVVVLNAP